MCVLDSSSLCSTTYHLGFGESQVPFLRIDSLSKMEMQLPDFFLAVPEIHGMEKYSENTKKEPGALTFTCDPNV